jgi:hypothetical protein
VNEAPLLIKGVPVKACQRIGFIEGQGRFAVELTNGQFFTLTSTELNRWVKASQFPDMEPEPTHRCNTLQACGVVALIDAALTAIALVYLKKVGLL